MLVDIFSCFDDNNQVLMDFYFVIWLFSFIMIFLFFSQYWLISSNFTYLKDSLLMVMKSEILRSKGKSLGGFFLVLPSLFVMILFLNFVGLVPYVFSPSSHLVFAMGVGFPIWFALIMSGVSYSVVSFTASFLPSGAPVQLSPFLVLIETVSIFVRPITLSVRLMANMSAGHIVLTLVGGYLSNSVLLSFSGLFLLCVQIFYSVFEFAICFIQAYIFCLLLTLYSDEHV